jgi:hypothetical protein
MPYHRFQISIPTIILFSALCPSSLQAAGQVQLELVGDARNTAMTFQEWGQALNRAGIQNVHIRSATEADKIGIDIQGTPTSPVYVVTGQIVSRDELRLPGQQFKRSDLKRLAAWLNDLAQNGPPDKRPAKGQFGLTEAQLEKVKNDLATPVGFSTKDLSRRDAVERIAKKLSMPVQLEANIARLLNEEKVEDDLSGLSCGTAIACLLRPAGYCLLPQADGNQIKLSILKSSPNQKEIWPVGRPPETSIPALLPGLYEFLNINVQNVSADTVLEAIGKRLKTPVLYDHLSLAKYKIDPAKAMLSFPSARSNYSMALQRMLFPAGLKFEVRQDDAGKPFLWVFTLKPI